MSMNLLDYEQIPVTYEQKDKTCTAGYVVA